MTIQDHLELVDWRRRVGDLYRLAGPEALTRDEDYRRYLAAVAALRV